VNKPSRFFRYNDFHIVADQENGMSGILQILMGLSEVWVDFPDKVCYTQLNNPQSTFLGILPGIETSLVR
jgi:hypothetical protein